MHVTDYQRKFAHTICNKSSLRYMSSDFEVPGSPPSKLPSLKSTRKLHSESFIREQKLWIISISDGMHVEKSSCPLSDDNADTAGPNIVVALNWHNSNQRGHNQNQTRTIYMWNASLPNLIRKSDCVHILTDAKHIHKADLIYFTLVGIYLALSGFCWRRVFMKLWKHF